MAGKIEKRGEGYRVRWTHAISRRRYSFSNLGGLSDAQNFVSYLNKREHQVTPDDSELVHETWRDLGRELRTDDPHKTFETYVTENIEARRGATDATKLKLKRQLKNHFADWAKTPIALITTEMIEEKLDCLKATAARTSYCGYALFISGIFRAAYGENVIRVNPAKKIELPQLDARDREAEEYSIFLSDGDLQLIHDAAREIDPQAQMIIRLFIATGMRVGELLLLRRKHLVLREDRAFSNAEILIRTAGQRGERGEVIEGDPKRGSKREIPLAPEFAQELFEYLEEKGIQRREAYIFPSPRSAGRRPWLYTNWHPLRWKLIKERAWENGLDRDVQPTIHGLRHTFVSRARQNGMVDYELSKILGHRGTRTLDVVYSHLGKDSNDRIRGVTASFLPPRVKNA